jgi:UDP-glucose 4-epimerase
MKILSTGGAGFIGTNLIKKLISENNSVMSIDNYSTGLKSNHQKGCKYLDYDIKNILDYSVFEDFDIIYHLAATARIQPSFQNPEEYFINNANATFKLAKYCSWKNIPLVYAGSSSHHSGKFKNPYTFSKDIGEEIIQLFQIHYGLKASIARFYNVYGPYHLKEGGYCTLIGAWEKRIE